MLTDRIAEATARAVRADLEIHRDSLIAAAEPVLALLDRLGITGPEVDRLRSAIERAQPWDSDGLRCRA